MHRTLALAALIAAAPHAAGATQVALQPQVHGLGCLRPETKAMMRRLQARIGLIEVTSTCGGRHARNSMHYRGLAVDFRPLATTPARAVAVLRGMPGVGGVGSYRTGIVHADVGERRLSWFGSPRTRHAARHRHYAAG